MVYRLGRENRKHTILEMAVCLIAFGVGQIIPVQQLNIILCKLWKDLVPQTIRAITYHWHHHVVDGFEPLHERFAIAMRL